jgi:hypothetical protein
MEQIQVGSRNQDLGTTAAQESSSGYAIAGQLAAEAYNHYPCKSKSFSLFGSVFSIRIHT